MKKYSFIIWLLVLVLVIGGGYYVVNILGSEEEKPVVANPETPREPSSETPDSNEDDPTTPDETESVEDQVNDFIAQFKIEEPFQIDFIVYNNEGEEVSISDYRGKYVILNFWASWCPPCIEEMPEFQALHNSLDPEETVILAINLTDNGRETKKSANKFIADQNLNLNVLYDEDLNGYKEFTINSIPQTFVLDKEGFVQYGLLGMTDQVVLNAMLESVK